MPYESVPLDPQYTYDLPRVPMLEGNMIPLPVDGRWVRVDTPDGPMAMRMLTPSRVQTAQEYYVEDDEWEDEFWNMGWDDP